MAKGEQGTDASGNPILQDVGVWMKGELKKHFKEADIKFIEPSYMIRSTPTISSDRIYCKVRYLQHGLMRGMTRLHMHEEVHCSGAGARSQCRACCVCWLHWSDCRPGEHPLCVPSHPCRHPGASEGKILLVSTHCHSCLT